jgi:hypothetical protein
METTNEALTALKFQYALALEINFVNKNSLVLKV